jgi:hypothetical protein
MLRRGRDLLPVVALAYCKCKIKDGSMARIIVDVVAYAIIFGIAIGIVVHVSFQSARKNNPTT